MCFHLLKTRRFLALFVTQFFGAFNDNAFKNAFLIWFTYDAASNFDNAIIITLAAGLFILPFFLFSAIAGQIADKYEKASLTKKIKLLEISLMLLCSICFTLKSTIGLLFLIFCMGLQSTFFGPIKYSLLPEHLKKNELLSGNGLIEAGTFLAILLGTIFGGLIINSQYGILLLSSCLILFACIGWMASCYIPKTRFADQNLKINWNIISQTKLILNFAKEREITWYSIIGISWFWLIGISFLTQLPVYTKEIIQADSSTVIFFLTTFSVGIGLGAICCNTLLKSKINPRLLPYGAIGMSLAIFMLIVFSNLYKSPINHQHFSNLLFFLTTPHSLLITLSLFALSFCAGIYTVPLYAILQYFSKPQYLARIIAANNIMNALFMVIVSIITMLLYSQGFSTLEIFLTIGAMNLLVFLFIYKKLTSSI